jgi:hypothetical protein
MQNKAVFAIKIKIKLLKSKKGEEISNVSVKNLLDTRFLLLDS